MAGAKSHFARERSTHPAAGWERCESMPAHVKLPPGDFGVLMQRDRDSCRWMENVEKQYGIPPQCAHWQGHAVGLHGERVTASSPQPLRRCGEKDDDARERIQPSRDDRWRIEQTLADRKPDMCVGCMRGILVAVRLRSRRSPDAETPFYPRVYMRHGSYPEPNVRRGRTVLDKTYFLAKSVTQCVVC